MTFHCLVIGISVVFVFVSARCPCYTVRDDNVHNSVRPDLNILRAHAHDKVGPRHGDSSFVCSLPAIYSTRNVDNYRCSIKQSGLVQMRAQCVRSCNESAWNSPAVDEYLYLPVFVVTLLQALVRIGMTVLGLENVCMAELVNVLWRVPVFVESRKD